MARLRNHYVCQSCGASHTQWSGRCDACNAWNSIVEETQPDATPGLKRGRSSGRKIDFVALQGTEKPSARLITKIAELDRVTGGGFVPGSALLIGGDPGIGKSTLLLQVTAALSLQRQADGDSPKCLYISGEEAVEQIRLRARRLGLADAKVGLAAASSLSDILTSLEAERPALVVIDSIQTLFTDALDSAPGTVAQVRATAAELIRLAKRLDIVMILVGHVTKDGMIAGPRVLEHMVDTVLYFEGDRGHQFRILRGVKNRFGPTDEIGVFTMTDGGLVEVANPSALFLAERRGKVSGSTVFAGMEGTRPILVEVQALLAKTTFSAPRRAVVGWDSGRLAMILAVLETRCGLALSSYDVYLNIAGGLKIAEPAADMAVAAALVSSLANAPIPDGTVTFGEIGLGGEIRAVSQMEQRLKEAKKLGFSAAWMPSLGNRAKRGEDGITLQSFSHIRTVVAQIAADSVGSKP